MPVLCQPSPGSRKRKWGTHEINEQSSGYEPDCGLAWNDIYGLFRSSAGPASAAGCKRI